MTDSTRDGSTASGTGDGGDPLYYVWTAVWSWLVAGVVLVSLVVSFTSGSAGLVVHLTQAGQAILLAFLVWVIPAASLKLLRSSWASTAKQPVRNLLHEHGRISRDTPASFWVRWLRLLRPRKQFKHESLRIAPIFILCQIFLVWGNQTSGRVSPLVPAALTAVAVGLMVSVAPMVVLRVLRAQDPPATDQPRSRGDDRRPSSSSP